MWLVLPYWKAQGFCDSFHILFCSQPTLLIFSPHFSTRISFLKGASGYALSSLVIIILSFFILLLNCYWPSWPDLLFFYLAVPHVGFSSLTSTWTCVPALGTRVLITEWPGKSWPDLHFDVFSAGATWLFCRHPSVPLSYSIPVAGLFLCFNWKCLNAPDIYPVPFAIYLPLCRCSHSVSIRNSLCTDQNQLCVSNLSSPLSSEHSYPIAYFTYPRRFSISISNLSCHLCP